MPEVGTWLQAEDRGHWYDAKVVKTKEGAVFVHWHGFKKSAQRWVPLVHARIRFGRPSPEKAPPADEAGTAADADAAEVVEVTEVEGEGAADAAEDMEADPAPDGDEEEEEEEAPGRWWVDRRTPALPC